MNRDEDEWANAQQIRERFGLPRGTLMRLAAQGRIKVAILKMEPTSRKSVRLFGVDSIRELLNNHSK